MFLATTIYKIHSRGIGHFDLKEENIFMITPYIPVIGDLGMTRSFSDVIGTQFFAGSK